jgi:hypothetical protein
VPYTVVHAAHTPAPPPLYTVVHAAHTPAPPPLYTVVHAAHTPAPPPLASSFFFRNFVSSGDQKPQRCTYLRLTCPRRSGPPSARRWPSSDRRRRAVGRHTSLPQLPQDRYQRAIGILFYRGRIRGLRFDERRLYRGRIGIRSFSSFSLSCTVRACVHARAPSCAFDQLCCWHQFQSCAFMRRPQPHCRLLFLREQLLVMCVECFPQKCCSQLRCERTHSLLLFRKLLYGAVRSPFCYY